MLSPAFSEYAYMQMYLRYDKEYSLEFNAFGNQGLLNPLVFVDYNQGF